ncbi:hypothetical protein PUN28_018141 [Cardiocondyla obscurior]|uniref:Uncharacterized protein n=1 Tax=Cardiocondyla obscurior TaxID=286306 RepID=A0AAW2EJW5_9HYME
MFVVAMDKREREKMRPFVGEERKRRERQREKEREGQEGGSERERNREKSNDNNYRENGISRWVTRRRVVVMRSSYRASNPPKKREKENERKRERETDERIGEGRESHRKVTGQMRNLQWAG